MPSERSRLITRIHVAKGQLAMDEEEYRFMLRSLTDKDSCKALNLRELYEVEAHLKKLGWKPKPRKQAKRLSPVSTGKQVDKLRAIWIDMAKDGLIRDGSENALEQWVIRMSARYNQGRGIEKLDWLEQMPGVCARVLESLKRWDHRARKAQDKAQKKPLEKGGEGDG